MSPRYASKRLVIKYGTMTEDPGRIVLQWIEIVAWSQGASTKSALVRLPCSRMVEFCTSDRLSANVSDSSLDMELPSTRTAGNGAGN